MQTFATVGIVVVCKLQYCDGSTIGYWLPLTIIYIDFKVIFLIEANIIVVTTRCVQRENKLLQVKYLE
jgi:hypothetical protein